MGGTMFVQIISMNPRLHFKHKARNPTGLSELRNRKPIAQSPTSLRSTRTWTCHGYVLQLPLEKPKIHLCLKYRFHLPVYLPVTYLSTYLPTIYRSACQIYVAIFLSIYQSIYPSAYLNIYRHTRITHACIQFYVIFVHT